MCLSVFTEKGPITPWPLPPAISATDGLPHSNQGSIRFCGDKNSVDIKVSQSYGKRMLWQKSGMGPSDGEQVRFRNLSRHQVER